jgi:hypothetical protein
MEIFGVSRYIAVPAALIAIWSVTVLGNYTLAERVCLVMGLTFLAYPIAAFLGHPGAGAVFSNMLWPHFLHSTGFPCEHQRAARQQSLASAQENSAALEQIVKGLRPKAAEATTEALVRNRAQLLGHGEAVLLEATLRCWNCQVQGVAEIGSRERYGEGDVEARLVQLIDRNDHEGAGLCLLPPAGWVGVGPVDIALARLRLYHSGAGASKLDSSSSLSAR